MTNQPRIRKQIDSDVSLGEFRRDAQQAFDRRSTEIIRTVEIFYAEPMVLSLGKSSRPPAAIEAIRVVDLADQNTPVIGAGGVAHFDWEPQKGGAQIKSVNGMTLAANGGKKYRLTFRATFAPFGGG